MTDQEKIYFDELRKDRLENSRVLQKQSMRGIKKSVIEKYTDQAHFIYELLQNADDAKATRAEFFLFRDKLIFKHNGAKRFSISNPQTEVKDSVPEKNQLGDVNAITSIGNSNKTAATIGKFGIGFKAVFQYTSTPHIYSTDFSFCIENFIVPSLLPQDACVDKSNELFRCGTEFKLEDTLFEFPFDKKDCPPQKAFDEISGKMRALVYPILFLSHLEQVAFTDVENQKKISYGKKTERRQSFGGTTAELISLTKNQAIEKLWIFSREEAGLRYCVGFFLNDAGRLKPVKQRAFCFFLTKKATGLNFVIHAPFLLNDSREGILAGNEHNTQMIHRLAKLAADSLIYLRKLGKINDDILSIIPIDETDAAFNVDEREEISFRPFYDEIKNKMKTAEILPSSAGNGHASSKNAYWAHDTRATEIFSNAQLAAIVSNPDAKWVFVSRERPNRADNETSYITSIVQDNLNNDVILKGRNDFFNKRVRGVTENFIESQEMDWLHKFYKWLARYKIKIDRTRPFFLDETGKAASAAELFLPVTGSSGYRTVHPDLLANPETKNFLVEVMGIREPDLMDEVTKKILPRHNARKINIKESGIWFEKIFRAYKQCPQQNLREYLENVKSQIHLLNTPRDLFCRPTDLYFPNQYLREYFGSARKLLNFDFYFNVVSSLSDKYLKTELEEFFIKLGVSNEVRYIKHELTYEEAKSRGLTNLHNSTRYRRWIEWELDGCLEILAQIEKNLDEKKSFALWKRLVAVNQNQKLGAKLRYGRYEYFFRTDKSMAFESKTFHELRSKKWLVDRHGFFRSAAEICVTELAKEYDVQTSDAKDVIGFLEIAEKPAPVNLTAEQQKAVDFFRKLKNANFTDSEIAALVQEQIAKKNPAPGSNQPASENKPRRNEPLKPTPKPATVPKNPPPVTAPPESEELIDADEFTPEPVDYEKKLERAQARSEREQEEIKTLDELQRQISAFKKYSFGWFKTLLEMEILNSSEKNLDSREVSISFGRVEREENSARTLVLKYPSHLIPQFMEDLENIPLKLFTPDKTFSVEIEVVSVRHNTLRAKIKDGAQIRGVNLNEVKEASISAKNPVFLLHELQSQFKLLGYDDNFDMKQNLCANIEFIFGPPGTGKTTYLAREIIRLIKNHAAKKILVLAPTNKAADVLVKKILSADKTCKNWLVRFGSADEEIERAGVFRDKTFDIQSLFQNVTVTTIARFPYDFFMPPNKKIFLRNLNWDHIIIDEASMIPLVQILLPLYKKTPEKFIIAGDPFQIEPVVAVDLWKGENIYSLVNLKSFTDTKTEPHQYPVKTLDTQYRSIPTIGEVFSKFTYGGILRHNRVPSAQRNLNIGDWLEIQALNIIKFPVSRYESIFRAKRLNGSSNYQIYSALFSFEFVRALSEKIAEKNPGENFTIGIIAPYRAQAEIISKLFAKAELPETIDVPVGTIHGFQGDECDIIVTVFNPPPTISNSPGMFLNKQNIINVAISRARDYLFIVMPNDDTANIENLTLINQVENLFYDEGCKGAFLSHGVEELIFDASNYIEENSFSTGHQNVNVYSKPEGKYLYEIRSEDNAVDVQIHKQ